MCVCVHHRADGHVVGVPLGPGANPLNLTPEESSMGPNPERSSVGDPSPPTSLSPEGWSYERR
eukprot:6998190-Pyramimonas_sp.AAC.1